MPPKTKKLGDFTEERRAVSHRVTGTQPQEGTSSTDENPQGPKVDQGPCIGLGHVDICQSMQTLAGVVQHQQQQQIRHQQLNRLIELQELVKPFKGTTDPLEADEWLKELEKTFDCLRYTDQERLDSATFMLWGSADDWWQLKKRISGKDVEYTWGEFKTAFYTRYFPPSVKFLKENEFFNLKQGSRTVLEYEAEFNRLGRFVPSAVLEDNGFLARRFQEGLREPIRQRVKDFQIGTYAEVVSKALVLEEGVVKAQQARDHQQNKRFRPIGYQGGQSLGNQAKKPWTQHSDNRTRISGGDGCSESGGPHAENDCCWASGACFKSGQQGHKRVVCPQIVGAQSTHMPQTFGVPPRPNPSLETELRQMTETQDSGESLH
ncbi:uncharacterized protein LOC143879783 [Tasmannia lanceolata]|uniref:uncharacterized protein LOC143879783 n=1 Tax=Tasmannia lanceolata TaxID=3420 RepID=UPI004062A007